MRALPIDDPALRAAADAYADAIISIAGTESRDRRDSTRKCWAPKAGRSAGSPNCCAKSARARGRVLANDFARTLAHDKWQSIILGIAGVLIGLAAALFVVRRTVRPLKAIAGAIRSLAGGEKHTSIPATDVRQRDRRYRARRRSVSPHAGRRRHRARGGGSRAGRAAAGRGKLSQAVRRLGRRNLRDDAGRRAAQRQSGAGADDGIRYAGRSDQRHRRHHARSIYVHPAARARIPGA